MYLDVTDNFPFAGQPTKEYGNGPLYSYFIQHMALPCLTQFGLKLPQLKLMIFHPNPNKRPPSLSAKDTSGHTVASTSQ